MARAPPQLPAHMPGVPKGVSRLQRGRHGAGARAHGHRCAPVAVQQALPAERRLGSNLILHRSIDAPGSHSDAMSNSRCLCAGHAGAGLCWNVAPKQPAHFEVVDVQWGFMKVDANATHIAMEVGRRHTALKGSQLASSVQMEEHMHAARTEHVHILAKWQDSFDLVL